MINWHSNAAGMDYSLTGGRFQNERVAGGDLATQLGGMAVRAELTRNAPDADRRTGARSSRSTTRFRIRSR